MNRCFPPELRTASVIARWSIVWTLTRDTVSNHSYFVALYAREKTGVGPALAELGAAVDQLQRSHGCRVRPIAYAVRDAARRWRAREAPFADIRRDAVVLFGPPLAEGLRG